MFISLLIFSNSFSYYSICTCTLDSLLKNKTSFNSICTHKKSCCCDSKKSANTCKCNGVCKCKFLNKASEGNINPAWKTISFKVKLKELNYPLSIDLPISCIQSKHINIKFSQRSSAFLLPLLIPLRV